MREEAMKGKGAALSSGKGEVKSDDKGKANGKPEAEKDFEIEFSTEGKLTKLPLDKLTVDDKLNARNHGRPIDIKDPAFLAFVEVIRAHGMLAPVLVDDQSTDKEPKFVLVAGFRRVAAAKMLGWDSVQARVIRTTSIADIWAKNMLENEGREPLRPYDLAIRLTEVKKKFKVSGTAIAKKIGRSDGYVNNLIRMREKLHPSVLDEWQKSEVNYQGCKDLAAIEVKEEQLSHPIYLAMINQPVPPKKGGRKSSDASGGFKLRPKREIEEFLRNLERKVVDESDPSGKSYAWMKINFPGRGYEEITDDERFVIRTIVRYMIGKWPTGTQGFYEVEPEETDDDEEEESDE